MNSWTAEQIFESWKQFMTVHPNSLIVGLTRDTTENYRAMISELTAMASAEFGVRYVDLHAWLLTYGLAFNGLTATSADNSAIAGGQIPPALLSDTVHFNEYGKKAVAHLVEERMKKLGVL